MPSTRSAGVATDHRLARPRTRQKSEVALRALEFAVPLCLLLFLSWPMLFTSSGMAQDWTHHLWYLWQQGITISRDHQPSLFLNHGGSVFYPLYAFYGGTIYALFGGLASLLGEAPVVAYVFSYVLGFTAAYSGWFFLGRRAGLGRWQAQVPSVVFVTSAYYLTLVYARGDWPEFLAVSTLPLLVAAAIEVLLAERLRLRWAILLVVCGVVFFGSHDLTMLWGVTALAIGALITAAAIPQARALLTRRGVARVAVLLVPAALVNAWYLFPALAYGSRTEIATTYNYTVSLRGSAYLVSAGNLFTLSRASVVGNTPDFALALPVLAVAWIAVSIVLSFVLRGDRAWRRMLLVMSALGIGFGVLMTNSGLILDLPRPYTLVQFSYRLETYILFALCGAVVAALALARTWSGRWPAWSWTVIVVLIAGAVGAVQQVDGYPRGNVDPGVVVPDRYVVFDPSQQPPFSGGLGDYNDASLPLAEPRGTPVGLGFPTTIRDQHVTVSVDLPRGVLVHTNLTGAPYFVSVTGAKVVGRDASGDMVLEMTHGGPALVSLNRSHRLPVVLGRVVTICAVLALLLMLAVYLARRLVLRRRHAGS